MIECNTNYAVSDCGRIKRLTPENNTYPGKILSQGKTKVGYNIVGLCRGGVSKWYSVHRLVLEAFVGSGIGFECNHKDHNKTNNSVDNLEWLSIKDHGKDNRKHGTQAGVNNGNAKLTIDDIEDIRAMRKAGMKLKDISTIFNVTMGLIGHIANGRSWRASYVN